MGILLVVKLIKTHIPVQTVYANNHQYVWTYHDNLKQQIHRIIRMSRSSTIYVAHNLFLIYKKVLISLIDLLYIPALSSIEVDSLSFNNWTNAWGFLGLAWSMYSCVLVRKPKQMMTKTRLWFSRVSILVEWKLFLWLFHRCIVVCLWGTFAYTHTWHKWTIAN